MKRLIAIVLALLSLGIATAFASLTAPNFVRVPAVGSQPLGGSAVIDGSRGGTLTVGRFTVRVPVGAYLGKATIAIAVPDPRVLQCNLAITPASANHFVLPVVLQTNVKGATGISLLSLQTVTLDESTGIWRLVPNVSVNVLNQTVYTPLLHFSKYGIVEGKGGW